MDRIKLKNNGKSALNSRSHKANTKWVKKGAHYTTYYEQKVKHNILLLYKLELNVPRNANDLYTFLKVSIKLYGASLLGSY